ncbi:hypothetical protein F2Q68_00038959 [Brassica cretica]|uniref:Uncharacterized protein n=2 Tax=Brassica cretica TaxID=69181 RepID=A0ABQ7A662_BRACR|nr:hypothetical protein F2Q68_00038959 [Brassica cretica]KAF3493152.1 hypothetical protein DY000_02052530 [Brassica cretica]
MEFQSLEEMLEYDVNVKEAIIAEEVNQVMQTFIFQPVQIKGQFQAQGLNGRDFQSVGNLGTFTSFALWWFL